MRSYTSERIVEKVRAAGGEIYAISSEPQGLSERAANDWELDFEAIGDPHHEIANSCSERGWLNLFVNERLEFLRASSGQPDDWTPTHPKGYFQPGVLAVSANGRVLYRWRGVPTHSNMGGATERPTAVHVWSQIEQALANGDAAEDAPLDTDPPLDSAGVPWPFFAAMLIAQGWFLNARGFESSRQFAIAGIRLLAFVAAWVAAFVWLPALLVTAALALWIVYITPRVRWVGREFQHVASSEPYP